VTSNGARIGADLAGHIRALTAIADCGSFEAAARRLDISQPALHRSARDLERVIRRSLVENKITDTQRELARRLKVALRELEYGVEEIRAAQGIFRGFVQSGFYEVAISHSAQRHYCARRPHRTLKILSLLIYRFRNADPRDLAIET
jgi:DNA-binding transcriptional LysR family regulator